MISDVDGWRVHSFRRFSSFFLGLNRGWIVIKLCKLGRLESYFPGFILGWINIQQTALFTKSSVQYFPTKDLFPLYRGSIIEGYACVCGVIPKMWYQWFIIRSVHLIPQSAPERADVKMGGLAVEVELGRPPGIDSARETLLAAPASLRCSCGPGRRKSQKHYVDCWPSFLFVTEIYLIFTPI